MGEIIQSLIFGPGYVMGEITVVSVSMVVARGRRVSPQPLTEVRRSKHDRVFIYIYRHKEALGRKAVEGSGALETFQRIKHESSHGSTKCSKYDYMTHPNEQVQQ